MSKEQIYDERVSPLVKQIIALCKAHGINAFMTFALDVSPETGKLLRCTSSLPNDRSDEEGWELVEKLHAVVNPAPPVVTAVIVFGGVEPS